jgi:hypothetical protein
MKKNAIIIFSLLSIFILIIYIFTIKSRYREIENENYNKKLLNVVLSYPNQDNVYYRQDFWYYSRDTAIIDSLYYMRITKPYKEIKSNELSLVIKYHKWSIDQGHKHDSKFIYLDNLSGFDYFFSFDDERLFHVYNYLNRHMHPCDSNFSVYSLLNFGYKGVSSFVEFHVNYFLSMSRKAISGKNQVRKFIVLLFHDALEMNIMTRETLNSYQENFLSNDNACDEEYFKLNMKHLIENVDNYNILIFKTKPRSEPLFWKIDISNPSKILIEPINKFCYTPLFF